MINLETLLSDFINFIKTFETKLKEKFNTEKNPYFETGIRGKISKRGVIDGYEYHYHGGGCTFKYKGVICEYGIYPNNGTEVQFTLYGLVTFIGTNPIYSEYVIDKKELQLGINNLVEKGELSMYELGEKKFELYLIN